MVAATLEYAWLIPLYPILAAAIVAFLGTRIKQGGAPLVLLGVAASFVHALLVFLQVIQGNTHQVGFEWIVLTSHTISMGVLVDNLSSFLTLLVSFVAMLIVIYSWGYMSQEGTGRRRYYAEVGLFIGAMLGTVLADNLLLMFIFWEIMGLCSYLLIGYWFHKPSAAAASLKAFLVTRIGDVMLLVGIIILFLHFGTFDYRELFATVGAAAEAGTLETVPLVFAGIMIFGGAVGKSAQFPLHVWLPDAMEGPTTVSALIHAATMVKAGVFLIARSFPIFVHVPEVFLVVGVIGGFTAILAASMALVNNDIKRVLAYSTISQLGYMFLALGAGGILLVATGSMLGYAVAMFHLMNHAVFKALLFLGAGSVGHAFHHAKDPYDMRQMGGLHHKMKRTSLTMLIGGLALAGILPFSGFFSKDKILAVTFDAGLHEPFLYAFWALALIAAFMTAYYMFRLWFRVFAGKPRSKDAEEAHESPGVMTTPLVILAGITVIGALAFLVPWGTFGGMQAFLSADLERYAPGFVTASAYTATRFLIILFTSPLTYLSLAVAGAGVGLAYTMHMRGRPDPEKVYQRAPGMHRTLTQKWYLDHVTNGIANFFAIVVSGLSAIFDRYILDGLINGTAGGIRRLGGHMRTWQTGIVTTYAATIIVSIGLLLILTTFLFPYLGW